MVYDFCVIGGGIVGIATAHALRSERPEATIVVLEKAAALATHQTGHNSGVIHAGIYYEPGSLKAELCRVGAQATKDFCEENDIPYEVPGKLLVATTPAELERMAALEARAQVNQIPVTRLDAAGLREREPRISGLGALLVESTGIVDYSAVTRRLADHLIASGVDLRLNTRVTGILETSTAVHVSTDNEQFSARQLVVCAGLQADRLAHLAGLNPNFRIVPFRGEYYRLPATHNEVVSHLIYPIPNPELPFLGVHLTRMIDGSVTVGPNAVLGRAREGYPKSAVSWRDLREIAGFPGFWKLARAQWRTGAAEFRNSLSKKAYLELCRAYCPSLTLDDLLPMEAGIRAQAVLRDGTLVHDFLMEQTDRMLHVYNAPSPAATSALPIGRMIAEKCLTR